MTTDSKVKSDNAISLGTNIKKLRLEHSFTQAYMVRQMQSYSKYEKDLAHISASELVAITHILNTSLDNLFK